MSQGAVDSQPFLLGIDAGGSKTQVAIWTRGTVKQLRQHQASPNEMLLSARWQEKFPGLNLDTIDVITANQRMASLLEQVSYITGLSTAAMLRRTDIVMGMAGLDTAEDLRQAQFWMKTLLLQFGVDEQDAHLSLIPDVELALWAASPQGEGVVLIAGTGSNCYARNADRKTAKAGGMSEYFSDEGSGFMLGWEALHTVGKMHDGRLERTALYGQILAAYQAMNFAQLKNKIVSDPSYKHAIAQAAPVVQALAKQGEANASRIVAQAVEELSAMVSAVTAQVSFANTPPVFLVGGTLQDQFYRQQLVDKLYQQGVEPQIRLISQPVVGAINFQAIE